MLCDCQMKEIMLTNHVNKFLYMIMLFLGCNKEDLGF